MLGLRCWAPETRAVKPRDKVPKASRHGSAHTSCGRELQAFTDVGRGQRDVVQSLSLGARSGDRDSLDQTLGRILWTFHPSLDCLASVFLSALSSLSKNLARLVWPESPKLHI